MSTTIHPSGNSPFQLSARFRQFLGAAGGLLIAVQAHADLSINRDNDPVFVNEGDNYAENSGTFTEGDYAMNTIFANLGNAYPTGGDTWVWDYNFTEDGPSSVPVYVAVQDVEGYTAFTSFILEIANLPPDYFIGGTQNAIAGQSQTFTLGTFSDPGPDSPWSVTIDWGDGSTNDTFTVATEGALPNRSHTFAAAGNYSVSVTINDGDPGGVGTSGFGVSVAAAPEIVVEQPGGSPLTDAASTVSFGSVFTNAFVDRTFTVKNTGGASLTLSSITLDGTNAGDFAVIANPAGSIGGPTGTTTFVVRFTPSGTGLRTASLHLANSDADEHPFDIALTGTGLAVPEFPEVTQQAYVKASNTGAGDHFGAGLALSGNTMVVGAYYEASAATGANGDQGDDSAPGAGAVYVLGRSGSNWIQQAYLKSGASDPNDYFGGVVAISGDTLLVTAAGESSSATGVDGDEFNNDALAAGAAYVFVRSGTNWTRQAYLKASNTEALDRFGGAAAISGDTIVIGAYNEASATTGVNGNGANNSAPFSGAAYVFVRNGTNWTQQAYLKASNTGQEDTFGGSVAISGDTIVVGALSESSSATGVNGNQSNNSALYSGAAYVFTRSGTNWSQQAYLKAHNTGADDRFGASVDISGDTVAVGAYWEDSSASTVDGDGSNNSATNAGAVYVFQRTGTNWAQQAYLKAENSDAQDEFGGTLKLSGDSLLVGAPGESSSATGVNGNGANNSSLNSGAAYLFARDGSSWLQRAYLKAGNSAPIDLFGGGLALAPGLIAVGAVEEDSSATGINGDASDNSATGSGAVYVFDTGDGVPLSTPASWRLLHFGTTNNSGNAANGADPNGNGIPNLVEFAFGMPPTLSGPLLLPVAAPAGTNFVLTFTEPDNVSGITYGAERSTSLLPGTWTPVPDTGTPPQHVFSTPMTGNETLFLRIIVSEP